MRRIRVGTGLVAVARDGTVAAIVPGPYGRGLRISIHQEGLDLVPHSLDGRFKTRGGRPPHAGTVALRRLLALDVKGTGRPRSAYLEVLTKHGVGPASAAQILGRELRRFGITSLNDKKGRTPSGNALLLRQELLAAQSAGIELKRPRHYVARLVATGVSRNSARNIVYRELDLARRLKAASRRKGRATKVPNRRGPVQLGQAEKG